MRTKTKKWNLNKGIKKLSIATDKIRDAIELLPEIEHKKLYDVVNILNGISERTWNRRAMGWLTEDKIGLGE